MEAKKFPVGLRVTTQFTEDLSMQFFKYKVLIALLIGMASATAYATPINIPAVRVTQDTKVYTFFTFDAQKLGKLRPPLSVQQAKVRLDQQLLADPATSNITACPITGDVNATNVTCGNGAIQFGGGEFFTYSLATDLPGIPLRLDNGVREQFGANFLSPNNPAPGDTTGRVVRIHFNKRMAQFGLMIDPGPGGSVSGIQFIVNRQTTPVQALTPGIPQFVGVEDSAGFTDVTIIATGTVRAWVADQFSYLPLANF
jgi:hypothetical protein